MTQSSRRRSGSKPHDMELRKSDVEERERQRKAAEDAVNRTPEQRALFNQQLAELSRLVTERATWKQMTEVRRRFAEERKTLEEG